MRLIDADKLMAMFSYPIDYSAVYVRKMIDAAPTIDPVRHGRWVCEKGVNVCSGCGGKQHWDDWDELEFTPWCHNCGERMDAEEENDGLG